MTSNARTARFPEPLAAKVPAIGVTFWLVKVLTTGMGEAASDYLAASSLVLAGAVGAVGFVAALWLQFRSRRYVAATYWFAVAMVAVLGTMAADALHVALAIPYAGSTVFYAVAVAVVLTWWYRTEGTLSIHSITTRRREMFYWAVVLLTFALGTAAGDLTAASMGLGYLDSAAVFAVIMLFPVVGWRFFQLNPVIAFWAAYVVTRPLGASVADWWGKPASRSGLGWGDGPVTTVAVLLIVALVAWVARTRQDIQTTTRLAPVADGEPARPAPTPGS